MENKRNNSSGKGSEGLTIIEISLVLAILIALAGLALTLTGGMDKWKKGKEAGEQLRVVYIAQKAYMADHPTTDVSTLTTTVLMPYLVNGATVFPVVKDLDGNAMTVNVTVMPPVVTPDPSGTLDDGLWDVGKP
jgi:type II secretory pathway pseudopilin PulG